MTSCFNSQLTRGFENPSRKIKTVGNVASVGSGARRNWRRRRQCPAAATNGSEAAKKTALVGLCR